MFENKDNNNNDNKNLDESITKSKHIKKKICIQHGMGKLVQTHQIKLIKKELARLLTIKNIKNKKQ